MSVDVHNHVMPSEALDLLRSDPGYGVTIAGDTWGGVHHAGFTIDPSFYDPVAKLTYLDARRIGAAVVSPPHRCTSTRSPLETGYACATPRTMGWRNSVLTLRVACSGWPTCRCRTRNVRQ